MDLRAGLSRLLSASLDLLYPQRCASCGREGSLLCVPCVNALPRLQPPFCPRCAQPLSRQDTCRRCRETPLNIDGIRSPFLMEGSIREAIHRLKYSNLRAVAPILGGLLAPIIADERVPAHVLVPVPLHARRERQRGYNQARLLADGVGDALGLPVASGALARVKETPPQAKSAGVQERRTGVLGAFDCPQPALVRGRAVVLVDDVCTTGATLEACATALKNAGATSVWGVTLARES